MKTVGPECSKVRGREAWVTVTGWEATSMLEETNEEREMEESEVDAPTGLFVEFAVDGRSACL